MKGPRLVLPSDESELPQRDGRRALETPLWVVGTLDGLAAPTISIVGSRAPSDLGRRLAFALGRDLARAGVCVISGLALGIDGAAHAGALDGSGATIGVLGGGHRRFFPRSNLGLAKRIVENGGAVVSPFAPDDDARPHQFLQRNAIVAGLGDAVVIVEAAGRSGALNTASHAANLGIPVLAFPGDVDRPKVAGCLALIRDGATLVRGVDDVLEAIELASAPHQLVAPENDSDARALLEALAGGELGFDTLASRLGRNPGRVAALLVELEMRGLIEARSGARYAKR